MCSAVLAAYAASFDTAAQLCPSRQSLSVHMSAHTVDRGDGRRRSARQQHGDTPQHAIDEHADRAECPLPACDERPFTFLALILNLQNPPELEGLLNP